MCYWFFGGLFWTAATVHSAFISSSTASKQQLKLSIYLLHSTSGSTHTCRSSSLWTARDAYKQIRNSLRADQQQGVMQQAWRASLIRLCCNIHQQHPWPSKDSCPAYLSQKDPSCATAGKDRGGKLDKNTGDVRKNTRLQTHTLKGSRNGYATAREAGLVQFNPDVVPGFAWLMQLLVFHTST